MATFNRLDAEAQELGAQDRIAAAVAERDAEWRRAIEVVRLRNHSLAAGTGSAVLVQSLKGLVDAALTAVSAEVSDA